MRPRLSVVVSTRNDGRGGDLAERMRVSLGGLVAQLERHHVASELVLVDWNPPPGRPPAAALVAWPRTRCCSVRAIEVSPAIHRRYAGHERLGLHGAVAWNTGIRRARGEFVLPGTLDALYSDPLVRFLAEGPLDRDALYRVERRDVPRSVLEIPTLDAQLDWCSRNVRRVHRTRRFRYPGLPRLSIDCCGDFQLLARESFERLRGYREWDLPSAHCDSMLAYAAYGAGIREVLLQPPLHLYHIDHPEGLGSRIRRRPPSALRVLEHVLPARIRNRAIGALGWALGWRVTSEVNGVPTLDWLDGGLEICRELAQGRRPPVLNDGDWGLGRESLPERTVARAAWEAETTTA